MYEISLNLENIMNQAFNELKLNNYKANWHVEITFLNKINKTPKSAKLKKYISHQKTPAPLWDNLSSENMESRMKWPWKRMWNMRFFMRLVYPAGKSSVRVLTVQAKQGFITLTSNHKEELQRGFGSREHVLWGECREPTRGRREMKKKEWNVWM